MPLIEFFGDSGQDSDNPQANTSRLINCYREQLTDGQVVLKSVLGMEPFSSVTGVFVRDMIYFSDVLNLACNGIVWSITSAGIATELFNIIESAQTTLSSNQANITIAAGGEYYVWDGATLTNPTGGAFDDVGSVEFLNNYTLMTERAGRRIMWSNLAAPTSLNGLFFATADGRDDDIIRGITLGTFFWVLKETSHEIWYNTGGGGALAFSRIAGGVRDVGLLDYSLVARIPGSMTGAAFMIGGNERGYLIGGTEAQRVTTAPVETAIKTAEPVNVLAYEDEGKTFIAIIFRDAPAWVMDLSTQEWHERGEGADHTRWTAAISAKMGLSWYVARNNGEVSILQRSGKDGAAPLIKQIVCRTLPTDGQRPVVKEFELFPSQGTSDADVRLAVSRDSGRTYTLDKVRKLGGVGNYDERLIWRNQGQCRNFTARIEWSTADDITFKAVARYVI